MACRQAIIGTDAALLQLNPYEEISVKVYSKFHNNFHTKK